MSEQCSELFERVFSSGGGGIVRTCACGRIHYDVSFSGADWEEGELEDLQRRHAENPDKYVECDYTVTTMSVAGEEIVMGCECNTARRYENFIIMHAGLLAIYLRARAKMLRGKADDCDLSEEDEKTLRKEAGK
jgi:hypothetical protein